MTEHVVIEKRVYERLARRSRRLAMTLSLCAAMIIVVSAMLLAVCWQRGAPKEGKPPLPAPVIRVL